MSSEEYVAKSQVYKAVASVFKGGWIQFDSRKVVAAIEDIPACDVVSKTEYKRVCDLLNRRKIDE